MITKQANCLCDQRKHTDSCRKRKSRLQAKVTMTASYHDHIVNGEIVRCTLQRSKLGTLCSLCGFSVSKLASERVHSDLVAFGIL